MALAAPVTYGAARTVIDADGYPLARPRRAEGTARAAAFDATRPVDREGRPATVLAFPRRVAEPYAPDEESAGWRPAPAPWHDAAGATLPSSTFLTQHIAQERLTEGLSLDPYASATGAYGRSGRLSIPAIAQTVDLAV
ncbi:MAG: hypothetical protein IT563_21680 [Alphaproteobacteria bacterium]|nr:hypothetical protein [Alphaproteobacteria bacterium]